MKAREWLRWSGIESEDGFSHRLLLFLVAVAAFFLYPGPWTLAALCIVAVLYETERRSHHELTKYAMESAHIVAVNRLQGQIQHELAKLEHETRQKEAIEQEKVDKLQKDFADLQQKLKLLATPEQMEKLQTFFKSKLGVGAGRT